MVGHDHVIRIARDDKKVPDDVSRKTPKSDFKHYYCMVLSCIHIIEVVTDAEA